MTVVTVIKLPRPFPKKVIKGYPITPMGGAQMELDIKQAKQAMINGVISVTLLIGFFAAGWISKEIFILFMAGKGMNKLASMLVG